jgi:DNA-binding protein YbaB
MENNNITVLQDRITEALKVAAEKLMETKKKNKQKIAVSINGKIKIFIPK